MENANIPLGRDPSKMLPDERTIKPAFGLGRFAPFNWERSQDNTAIRPFWGRIMLWLLLLGGGGWATLATGMFVFVKYQRGFTDVRFSHMLFLPWKLNDYRRAKGEFFIKAGLANAEAQKWREALDLLRPGLLAVPDHREARLMLARIYLMAGRADTTRTLLTEGLRLHGDNLDYLRQVLGYFFSLQADETIIGLTGELRGRLAPETPAGRMANTALAYAYFNRARYAEAEAALGAARLLGTPEGRFVMARIAWMRGRHEEAAGRLSELTAQVPDDYEIYRTLIYYLSEEKNWGGVRRAGMMRQFALPDRPEGYVDFIEACGKEGDEARRAQAEEAFFARFTNDSQALLKLGELASREGRAEVARQVAARCRALGSDEAEASLFWLVAQLEQRDYHGMIALSGELSSQASKWSARHRMIFGGLRAVALYGLHQEAEAGPLARPLSATNLLSAQTLTSLAIQLQRVGQGAEARAVLRHAVALDPLNQPALVLLLRGLLADGQLQDALPLILRLPGMRNPPEDLLTGLSEALDSDRYLFLHGRERVRTMIQGFLHGRNESKSRSSLGMDAM